MKPSSAFQIGILVLLLYGEAVHAGIWAYTKIELYKNNQRIGTADGPGRFPGRDETSPVLYNVNNDAEYAGLFPDPGSSQYVAIYSMASAGDQLDNSSIVATRINSLWTDSGWAGLPDDIADAESTALDRIKMLDARGKSNELAFQVPYPNPYYDKIDVTFLAYSDDEQIDPLIYVPEPSRNQSFLSVDYCSSGCWADQDRYDIRRRFVKHHQWVKYTIDLSEPGSLAGNRQFHSPDYFPVAFLASETTAPGPYFGPRLYLNHIVSFSLTRSTDEPRPAGKPLISDAPPVTGTPGPTSISQRFEPQPIIKTTVNYRIHDPVKRKEKLLGIPAASSEVMVYTPEIPASTPGVASDPDQTRELHLQPDAGGVFRLNGWPYDSVSIVFTAESNQSLDTTRSRMVVDASLMERDAPRVLQPQVAGVIPGIHRDQNGTQYLTEGLGAAIVEFDPSAVRPGTYHLVFTADRKEDGWSAKQMVRIIIHEPAAASSHDSSH